MQLIIGVGNELRNDDGVGVAVARALKLQKKQKGLEGITIITASGEGTQLMESWQDVDKVIVIDAVRCSQQAGTIHRLDAADNSIPSDFFHYSTHAFSVAEAVELSRSLNRLPDSLLIYGIEGADFSYGETLSAPVQRAAQQVQAEIMAKITGAPSISEPAEDY